MIEIIPNYHPALVHFPIALIVCSTIGFLLSRIFTKGTLSEELLIFSKWALWLCGLFLIPTIITGFDAYNTVNHDAPSHTAMTEHKNWALPSAGVILLFAIYSFFRRNNWGQSNVKATAVALVVLSSLILTTGWYGAEAVYRFGLGVMSLPKVSGDGGGHGSHTHAPGEGHGNEADGTPEMTNGHAHNGNTAEKEDGHAEGEEHDSSDAKKANKESDNHSGHSH